MNHYLHVRGDNGPACYIVPKRQENIVSSGDLPETTEKTHAQLDAISAHPDIRCPVKTTMGTIRRAVRPESDMWSKVLSIKVRPVGDTRPAQTVGFITYRKCDGHKELYLCKPDGTTRPSRAKINQGKHTNIPQLCKMLGISREWEVTIV